LRDKEEPMPKAYWIARVDVRDADTYRNYIRENDEAFRKYSGQFLVRAGRSETLEGESRSRNVIVEFPDYDTAIACWHSDEYQRARMHRLDAAEADLLVIEGFEGGPAPDALSAVAAVRPVASSRWGGQGRGSP
jgi:uncharacterized protein (DUF1330 family)